MIELPLEYWNKLASQQIFISAFLGGFSLTIIASLLVREISGIYKKRIFKTAIISAASFLICLFASTNMLMMTTPGFPVEVGDRELMLPRLISGITFFIGIISLVVIISLAGWTQSKSMGRFTTVIGILTLILMISMLVSSG